MEFLPPVFIFTVAAFENRKWELKPETFEKEVGQGGPRWQPPSCGLCPFQREAHPVMVKRPADTDGPQLATDTMDPHTGALTGAAHPL